MVRSREETLPPTFDPDLAAQHKFVQKPDPLIAGKPDTVGQLRPGDQYIDGRTGCVVTVLAPEVQAAQDKRQRDKYRAQLAAGLESEQRCLAYTKAELVRCRQVADDAWAAVQAMRPMRGGEVNAQTIAVRNQTRNAWVRAVGVLEQHMETERAQTEGVATMRAMVKAT